MSRKDLGWPEPLAHLPGTLPLSERSFMKCAFSYREAKKLQCSGSSDSICTLCTYKIKSILWWKHILAASSWHLLHRSYTLLRVDQTETK